MATIDTLTSRVLTQDLSIGFSPGVFLTRIGVTPGQSSSQFQRFRGYLTTSGRVDWDNFSNRNPVFVNIINREEGTDDVIRTDFVRVVNITIQVIAGNSYGVVDVDYAPGEVGTFTAAPNVREFRYSIRSEDIADGEITSHRNFNFDSTVTLTGLSNVATLGTDSGGRIIVGRGGGNVTEGTSFPTSPNVGDIHIQTTDIPAFTNSGFVQLFRPAPDDATPILLSRRCPDSDTSCATNGVAYDFSNLGYGEIQIDFGNRNNLTPALGVAGNPLELGWRPRLSTADSEWMSLGTTIDSSPSRTFRVRIAAADAAAFDSQFNGVSLFAQLGYRANAPINNAARPAGTYVYGGDDGSGNPDWNQISTNSSSSSNPATADLSPVAFASSNVTYPLEAGNYHVDYWLREDVTSLIITVGGRIQVGPTTAATRMANVANNPPHRVNFTISAADLTNITNTNVVDRPIVLVPNGNLDLSVAATDLSELPTGGSGSALTVQNNGSPLNANVDLLNFGSGVVAASQAGDSTNIDISLEASVPRVHSHAQTTAATTWTINHALSTRYPVITVYDNNNNVVLPMEITATMTTQIQITFPVAVAGNATLVG